ncbi:MAG: family 43 glycosylhydrolase [Bacilli bacterium]|nr:family 43 glycosylhydrolase [Bacilli bacterium]
MKTRKTIALLLAMGALVGCSVNPTPAVSSTTSEESSSQEIMKYRNPLIYADCPDPSAVRDGNSIYIFGTAGRVYKIDDFEFGPYQLPDVLRSEAWGASAANIWAPDVYKIGDTWNYYYSNSVWGGEDTAGIGVMTSTSLDGPWIDRGKIFTSDEIGVYNSIDPVVIEDNGHIYMAWGSFRGIFIIELNEDGTALKNPATAKDDKVLIAGIVGGWNGGTYEGSYIRKIGEYFYYFGSQGTCCAGANSSYHVKVARSKSIFGPYVDSKGVDMLGENRGELVVKGDQNVAGPGHMSLIEDDNHDWWMFYHGYDKSNPAAGRLVFMDKLLWDDNGFPYTVSRRPSFDKDNKVPYFNQ